LLVVNSYLYIFFGKKIKSPLSSGFYC